MTSDQTENEKGGFASKLLPFIKKQTRSFKENYFCKRIRLGVTGLSKSGKTTFITSLIYQLQRDPTLQVSIVPDFPRDAKAFPYGDNITRLLSKNPQWPESTKEESEICLKIMFGKKEIFLEIVDYPGEWLLDLPMLEKSYAQWSENLQDYLKNIQETGLDWVDKAAFLSRNEQEMGETELNDKILEIADDYRKWLLKLKDKGFAYLQPGRFVLPDNQADLYTYVNFFPWVWEKDMPVQSALLKKLQQRYEAYKTEKIIPFYTHFKNLNKQIVLIDCLGHLQKGPKSWRDLKFALYELLKNFSYGMQNWLMSRLFHSFKIEGILFVATKADYVSHEAKRIETLTGILKSVAVEASEKIFDKKLERNKIKYRSVASVAVQSINYEGDQNCYYFPNGTDGIELPKMLTREYIENFKEEVGKVFFSPLAPVAVGADEELPNIEMYNVIDFILGDK